MKTTTRLILLATGVGFTLAARADILELKNGTILDGKYVGGTAATVRFQNDAGVQVIETAQVIALTFTSPPASAPAVAPTPAPTPAAQPQSVTLPAGTMLLVRMMDSVSSRNRTGATFATRLEYDLAVDGTAAVKGGTTIYGRVQSSTQAGRTFGRSTLDLRLAQIIINGQPVAILTSGYQAAGQASIAKAAKGAAAGATIGAIAGDAGKGAAIGATAGALTRGQTITVPPGTLLEFTLTQPVTFRL